MLKQLFACCLLIWAAGQAQAQTQAANRSMGSHGMLLFGGAQGLYASHLPMFHAPHDYQVLLRLRLADKAQDRALRKRLGGGAHLWTLDPENFALDRLAPDAAEPLRRFRADLVRGHFEKNGRTILSSAEVIVEKVLMFRPLSAAPAQAERVRYVQLGRGRQRFLVKQIDSRPDFDHVVALRAAARTRHSDVVLPRDSLAPASDAAIAQALAGAQVVGTVYFSTEDLR